MRTPVVASLVVLTLGAAGSAWQGATFKSTNRTVAVFATVTDQSGRLVPDLEQSAFQIDDNGRPQAISVFANDTQPITVVMMLDRSVSMRGNFELAEEAAEQFVAELGPHDKARIGSFSNRIQVDPRDFTSDHGELLGILRGELQDEGPTPLWNAVNVAITALLHQEGRRVILVFTDGVDDPFSQNANSNTLKGVTKRADEENVMIYAIGLAGNSALPRGGFGGPGRGRGGFGGGFGGGRGSFRAGPDPGLAKIAQETGGGYFELTNSADLAATFRRVAEELHHQYLLGFAPSTADGKMHRIDVRVRDADMSVRARKSYLSAVER
jgi:VWFA-related protein